MLSLVCSVPGGNASSSNVIVSVEVSSALGRSGSPGVSQRIRAELIKVARAGGQRESGCGAAARAMAPGRAWAPLCGLLGSERCKEDSGCERGGLGLGTGREVDASVAPQPAQHIGLILAVSASLWVLCTECTGNHVSCGFSVSSEMDWSGREGNTLRWLFTHQVWPHDGRPGCPEPGIGASHPVGTSLIALHEG